MISYEALPARAVQAFSLAIRFQKFLVVGTVGLLVNQAGLYLLHDIVGLRLLTSSVIAILVSMAVTFMLNEIWTWHDRGRGLIIHRLGKYVPINTGGLIINASILAYLVDHYDAHHLFANLIGAGVAAIWNFGLNNLITWRD
jgi:putative flippase GtrA